MQISRRRIGIQAGLFALGLCLLTPPGAVAQSLRGSRTSLARQNRAARNHHFTYLKNAAAVRKFVSLGLLVPVRGNRDYELSGVSFPYARPEVRLFVERLARQYHATSGEKLVVTSLTRPSSRQPRNASQFSVHPCGMAVDIRRSRSRTARRWLEKVLLSLEARGVVEATRERHPSHYHVAVFPQPYAAYVAAVTAGPEPRYQVRPGDSLWAIARRHGTSVAAIRSVNRIQGTEIFPGQVLVVPAVK